jgi:hypothetical protein
MPLRRRTVEPAEPGCRVVRHAVPVKQQLAVKRLRLGIALLGERMKKRRALPGIVREARGTDDGGGGCRRQNLNSTDPNTVRPVAIVA